MKKQAAIGMALAGITTIASAVTAIVINSKNKKQLNNVELKEEIKEEIRNETANENEENNKQTEEQLNIDDSDIEV